MKSLIALLVIAGLALAVPPADAATEFAYTPTNAGFVTSTNDTVEYVNVANYAAQGYKITLSVDGVVYQGFAPASGVQFTAQSADGGYALVTATWVAKVIVTGSGRGGGYRITRYYPGTGQVAMVIDKKTGQAERITFNQDAIGTFEQAVFFASNHWPPDQFIVVRLPAVVPWKLP